jgi:heme-degrading monooxygenase HmoA
MIARAWTGRVRIEDVDAYVEYVDATGLAAMAAAPGNVLAHLLVRELGDEAEIVVYSVWESMDAVRGFAGEQPERAVYYPEDARYLTHAPEEVVHRQIRRSVGAAGSDG